MSNVVPTLMLVALLLAGLLLLASHATRAGDRTLEAFRTAEGVAYQQAWTRVRVLRAISDDQGSVVEATLRNEGQTSLADFPRWDVVALWQQGTGPQPRPWLIAWLPYSETLGDRTWRVKGIYLDAANNVAELHEPAILNPGEELVIEVKFAPPVERGVWHRLVVATPNGVTTQLQFTR